MKNPTPKQAAFIREYVKDYNGTRAAIRAGYSAKTAAAQASMLLDLPHIAAHFDKLARKKDMDISITAQRVLDELAKIAFHDPGVYFKRNQNNVLVLKDIDELSENQRAAINEFDATARKLKLHDKPKALEMLGRHLKIFTEINENQMQFTVMGNVTVNGKELEFNVGKPAPKHKE